MFLVGIWDLRSYLPWFGLGFIGMVWLRMLSGFVRSVLCVRNVRVVLYLLVVCYSLCLRLLDRFRSLLWTLLLSCQLVGDLMVSLLWWIGLVSLPFLFLFGVT